MQSADAAIDDLRRQIDEIDTNLHDLLIRRADVVAQIGCLKGNGGEGGRNGFFRPGREAVILRRLVARHRGSLPKATIVRMWREMLSATLRQQGPFAVAVVAPAGNGGYWDVARDHFGSLTPATAHETANQVLRAVADGQASVGVLPLPREDEREPWWPVLVSRDANQPRVIARLPFGALGNVRGGSAEALVIGRMAPEETGRDRSLLVVESTAEMSRSGLRALLVASALAPLLMHLWRDTNDPSTWYQLVEVDGCVRPADARLAALAAQRGGGIRRIWPVGGYAVPLSAAELATPTPS
jgi:chorismate mutase-like protein